MTAPKQNRTKTISPMVKELTRYFVRLSKTAKKKQASSMITMPLSKKTEAVVPDVNASFTLFIFSFRL